MPETNSRPLKVVYVIDDLGLGGAQRQLVLLVTALPRTRFDIEVISLSADKAAYASAIREAGIPLTMIPHAGAWSWRTFFRVWSRMRRVRPDIVHTWLFTADLYGRLSAWLARVPVIMSAVRSVEPWKAKHYVAVDRLLRHVTDAFTVNARAIGDVLTARERINPKKLRVIYNGVDLEKFTLNGREEGGRKKEEKPGLPSSLFFLSSSQSPLVGIIGRLGPEKDQATFVRAAALVLQQVPAARFLIVGNGPLKGELRRLARRLGVGAQVHFLEGQSDIAPVFAALDLVVISSRYEGCCNVILEGMAMGKPVIATAVGGNPELVVPGHTGLLVPAQDSHAMANAIVRLVRSPHEARAMGLAGRQRIEEQFSLRRMIEEHEQLYLSGDEMRSSIPSVPSIPSIPSGGL